MTLTIPPARSHPPPGRDGAEGKSEVEIPARLSHFPNVYERSALQKLQEGELKAAEVGSATHLTKLVAKGWIACDDAKDLYQITSEGDAAMRANMPFKRR